jgi:hypothetical protein
VVCSPSLPPLNLLASLRVLQDEDNGEAAARPSLPPQCQSQSTSCKHGRCMSRCCDVRLRIACVMYTCFITPNLCPCLMRPLPCMTICHNTTTRRAASNHVSFPPLQCQCGARWATNGRQAAAIRRAPRSQTRRRTISVFVYLIEFVSQFIFFCFLLCVFFFRFDFLFLLFNFFV